MRSSAQRSGLPILVACFLPLLSACGTVRSHSACDDDLIYLCTCAEMFPGERTCLADGSLSECACPYTGPEQGEPTGEPSSPSGADGDQPSGAMSPEPEPEAMEEEPELMPPSAPPGACRSDSLGKPLGPTLDAPDFTMEGFVFFGHPRGPDWTRVGDVTGDGRADVVTMRGGVFSAIEVFVQTEDGQLDGRHTLDVGRVGVSGLVLTDLDADGLLDIVVSEPDGLLFYLSLGGGDFVEGGRVAGGDGRRIEALDIGNDGSVEIVTEVLEGFVAFGQTDTDLIAPPELFEVESRRYRRWCYGNLDGTGPDEFVVIKDRVWVHSFDEATGFFEPAGTEYAVGDIALESCAVGDLNNDQRDDLVFVDRPSGGGSQAWVLYQDANGELAEPLSVSRNTYSGTVAISDVNHDGLNDLVRIHSAAMTVQFQTPTGLAEPTRFQYPNSATETDPLEVGDVNCDGCPDIVVANASSLVVFYGQGCGG